MDIKIINVKRTELCFISKVSRARTNKYSFRVQNVNAKFVDLFLFRNIKESEKKKQFFKDFQQHKTGNLKCFCCKKGFTLNPHLTANELLPKFYRAAKVSQRPHEAHSNTHRHVREPHKCKVSYFQTATKLNRWRMYFGTELTIC